MAFEKGNKEQKKGQRGKGVKSLQWEALGESIVGEHSDTFNSILNGYLKPDEEGLVTDKQKDKFIDTYLSVLNYFKPKHQATTIDSKEGIDIFVKVPE